MNSAYMSKGVNQAVPEGLESRHSAHDVIVSRTRREILPTGNSQAVGENATINFQIASNWMDAKTAVLHAKVTVPTLTGSKVSVPKGDFTALFRSCLLEVKGQSLLEGNNEIDVYNALKQRLYEAPGTRVGCDQMDCGAWETATASSNYIYNSGRKQTINGVESMVYEIALPLSRLVDFYGLSRSYLPIFAIPQLLRLTTSTAQRAFFSDASGVTGAFKLEDVRIECDMLTLSDDVNAAFRELVMASSVSFHYPAHFCVKEGGTNSQIVSFKTNINASCLNNMLLYLAKETPSDGTDMSPFASYTGVDVQNANIGEWAVYIDSRNVFSTPIRNAASLFNELKKTVLNMNDRERNEVPAISAAGWLEAGGHNYQAANHFRDYNCLVYPVALQREQKEDSISGVNTALTGGNISVQLTTGVDKFNSHI